MPLYNIASAIKKIKTKVRIAHLEHKELTNRELRELVKYYKDGFFVNFEILNVSKVENMLSLFDGIAYFNQDISKWDTSSLRIAAFMFRGCVCFNRDLNGWNVDNVIDDTYMFIGTSVTKINLYSIGTVASVPIYKMFNKYFYEGSSYTFEELLPNLEEYYGFTYSKDLTKKDLEYSSKITKLLYL